MKLTQCFLILIRVEHFKGDQILVSALVDLVLDTETLSYYLQIEHPDLIRKEIIDSICELLPIDLVFEIFFTLSLLVIGNSIS